MGLKIFLLLLIEFLAWVFLYLLTSHKFLYCKRNCKECGCWNCQYYHNTKERINAHNRELSVKESICVLKCELDLLIFDPNTGEVIDLDRLRNVNYDNYLTYLATEKAIQALEFVFSEDAFI